MGTISLTVRAPAGGSPLGVNFLSGKVDNRKNEVMRTISDPTFGYQGDADADEDGAGPPQGRDGFSQKVDG